jgi:hypothetical protein
MSAPTSHSVADLSRGRVNGPYFLVVSLLTIYSASGITTHKRDGWKKIVVRIVSDGRAKVNLNVVAVRTSYLLIPYIQSFSFPN